ncbi:GNAT family N-acetyltransferase [Streptomyces sp. NPDC058469]|uniref:GNAT family N-acetyltransferase n=1 Tax=Streptomyces sp. NPDC058469 TaxID=3346514 RepID=UPI00365FDFA7
MAHERAATELPRTIAAFDGPAPVGGTAVHARVLTVPGALLPVAGVTWVCVTPTHRRRGILTSMMRRQLTDLHTSGAELIAALRPSEAAIYRRYGYGPATQGARLRCDERAVRFRPGTDFGDGTIRLLGRDQARPQIEKIYDHVRTDAVGWPGHNTNSWDGRLAGRPEERGGASALRFALHHDADGRTTGCALYRIKQDASGGDGNAVWVVELATVSRQAYATRWRFLAGIDLVSWTEYEGALDEPLPYLLTDPRAVRSAPVDRLWVRLVDVDRALAARRYAGTLDLVLEAGRSRRTDNSGSGARC